MEELLCFQYMENTKAPNNKTPKRRDFCVLSLLLLLCFMLTPCTYDSQFDLLSRSFTGHVIV